jgi:hypothetical protein
MVGTILATIVLVGILGLVALPLALVWFEDAPGPEGSDPTPTE